MEYTQNDNEVKVIIIYKYGSLAQKKAAAKYYYANKEKCIARSSKWATEHKPDENDKERLEIEKAKRKIYNQRFYARQKIKQEQAQEQEQSQEQQESEQL